MAKLKPAKGRKKSSAIVTAIPCLVLVVGAIVLMSVLFYLFVAGAG